MGERKMPSPPPAIERKPLPPPEPPLVPSMTLLLKLGSIAVHADEMLSPDGHQYDRIVLEQLLKDEEVKIWLARMDAMAMLPKKRRR